MITISRKQEKNLTVKFVERNITIKAVFVNIKETTIILHLLQTNKIKSKFTTAHVLKLEMILVLNIAANLLQKWMISA